MLSSSLPSKVALPLKVADGDGDVLALGLRFDGGLWTSVDHTQEEQLSIPASLFEGHLAAGPHSIEVVAADWYDVSQYAGVLGYVVDSSARVADDESAPTEEQGEQASKGLALSPAALAGIVAAAVAVFALVVVVVVVARRRKQKSSSTGLIENE
jgi:hypothetical protein